MDVKYIILPEAMLTIKAIKIIKKYLQLHRIRPKCLETANSHYKIKFIIHRFEKLYF